MSKTYTNLTEAGIQLLDLQTFLKVAEAGAVRRAAAITRTAQSVVTKRVRRLEDALGVSLFERHRGGVTLTEAGCRFSRRLQPALARLETAASLAAEAGYAHQGRLRIGIVASISAGHLNDLLRVWRLQHPEVMVSLVEASPQEHAVNLAEDLLDVAILTGEPRLGDYDVERLWEEPVFAAFPTEHPRATDHSIDLREMRLDHFIISEFAPGPEIRDYLVRRLSDLGTTPTISVYDVRREALLALVGLGFGVTLVSGAELGASYAGVAFVRTSEDAIPFSAVWRPTNDNPALRRFLSLARQQGKGG